MAKAQDTERTTDEVIAEREAAIEHETTDRDRATHAARQAELDRQQAIVDAVAGADLAGLGGPELNPGNPGHDPDTGEAIEP